MFDHNVPHKLRRLLSEHDVSTAEHMGWAGLKNGDLLAAAEALGFDVMVTADKNLAYQQNLASRKLAVIVLTTNRWKLIREQTVSVLAALDKATAGIFQVARFY